MRLGVLCGCIAALAGSCVLVACGQEQAVTTERVRAIKTITVSERSSGQLRRFPGVVEAVDTSVLSFEVSGNTREVAVNLGDRVTQGQVLATLDDTPFQLNVEAAQADVGRAKATLAEKETDFVRQRTLYEKDWVSRAAYDQAVAARDSAANEVAYATSKLNLARRDLDKTVLRAPFDGVIADKVVDPFQEVARGERVFDIYVEGAMQVELSVPETDIGDIYLGLPAEVGLPSDRAGAVAGRVSEVGTVASEANAFTVKVALTDAPAEVLPGMTAEVSLRLAHHDAADTFFIPISALVPGERPGRGYVFVYDAEGSMVHRTPVRGAGVRDNRVVIGEGLKAGDVIAVAGVSFLRDGQTVTLLDR